MTNLDLPQKFKPLLHQKINQCNSVRLLSTMMICTEAEKTPNTIQHPVKINISKRPKKNQPFYLMVKHSTFLSETAEAQGHRCYLCSTVCWRC